MTSNASPKSSSRRVVVVDRAFQLRYALSFAFAGAGCAMLCAGAMYLVLRTREVSGAARVAPDLATRDSAMMWMILGLSALMAVVLGLVGLIATHRIAGPVYALTRYLSLVSEGHYPQFRPLRKGDELQELFAVFQSSMEYLRAREVEEAYRLQDAISVLTPLATTEEAKEVLASLQALHARKVDAASRADTGSHVRAVTTTAA